MCVRVCVSLCRQEFQPLQIVGFVLLVSGALVYNKASANAAIATSELLCFVVALQILVVPIECLRPPPADVTAPLLLKPQTDDSENPAQQQ